MDPVQQKIKQQVETNPVVLYMKGSPDFPQCGFSMRVSQVLQACGQPFTHVNVLEDPEIREGIKIYGNWPTIPQLYIKGQLVGGCDITMDLYESGDLQKMLKDAVG